MLHTNVYNNMRAFEGNNKCNDDSHNLSAKSNSYAFKMLNRHFVEDISKILEERKNANYKNALEINKEMRKKLISIRNQMKTLQKKLSYIYSQNEQILLENMSNKKGRQNTSGKYIKGRTFFIKGSTFFREENMRNCPNNEDYTKRLKEGEVFPMDFELVARHIWSIQDKMDIVQGIKEQVISNKDFDNIILNKNEQLSSLLAKVGNNLKIDWELIATHNLRYRHSPFSCKAMWHVYLQPAWKHDSFSASENEKLVLAVQKYNNQNWIEIAKEVGKRSDYQCFLQYHTSIIYRSRWPRWNKKDDLRLLKAIEDSKCNGIINWSQVAFQFPQKSKASLQQRYKYAINPSLSHEPFSPEEDLLLIAAVQEYGKNFGKIPRSLFPNRSVIQLRQRYYNTIQNRDKITPWTLEDDKVLMDFVKDHGASSWKKCEEVFHNRHTRISCRQRYFVIQKHIRKNENFTLEGMVRKPYRTVRRSDITPINWQKRIEELQCNSNEKEKQNIDTSEETQKEKEHSAKQMSKMSVKNEQDKEIKNNKSSQRRSKKRKHEQVCYDDLNPRDSSTSPFQSVCINSPEPFFGKGSSLNGNELAEKAKNKTKYLDCLRANSLRFHSFFKYSYNFQFGHHAVIWNSKDIREITKANDCFRTQIPEYHIDNWSNTNLKEEAELKEHLTPFARSEDVEQILEEETTTVHKTMELQHKNTVPPNYSTIVALRSLCVLSVDFAKRKEELKKNTTNANSDITKKPITVQSRIAVNRFHQQFRNLFYHTAVLSRLPPSSLQNPNIISFTRERTEYSRPLMTNFGENTSSDNNLEMIKTECCEENQPLSLLSIKNELDC